MDQPEVLYLPSFDFHLLPQRPQQLLWALADEGFRVTYCNVTQKEDSDPFETLKPGFVLCHNLKLLNQEKDYIMWWTHGPHLDLLSKFNLKMLVGDLADATVEEFEYYNHWRQLMIKLPDLVFCASKPIWEEVNSTNHHCRLIRNGVNEQFFAKRFSQEPLPGEEEIARQLNGVEKIVGFWGAVATWLDYDLLSFLAKSRPDYLFVLVGPVNAPQASVLAAEHPNILLTGYRPYYELPAWARHFKVGIIPFQVRGVTQAANPIKMYEYMAAGLPVVATDLPEVRECPLVRVATDRESFLEFIDQTMAGKTETGVLEKRLKFAEANSWSSRAKEVAEAIRKILPKTAPRPRGSWSPKPEKPNPEKAALWDRIWEEKPSDWDSLSENVLNTLKNWAGDLTQLKMLEVGCGSGRISARLAKLGAEVTLLDYSQNALKTAEAVFDSFHLKGNFILGDMAKLPFDGESFDIVWSSGVLEHYRGEEQIQALKEMNRVCRQGGQVISLVMNSACFPYRIGKWFAEQTGQWPWGPEYPQKSLVSAFEAAGFGDVEEKSLDLETGLDFLIFLPEGKKLVALLKEWYRQLDAEEQAIFAGYLLATKGVNVT